jgi:hypothetical protein
MTETQIPPGIRTNFNLDPALRPDNRPLSFSRDINSTAHQNINVLDQERSLQQIIFDEAIEIGCDWREASNGEAITQAELRNLHVRGYATHTPEEILGIFYDWEDYQAIAQSYYEDREDPEVAKHLLVESLRQEAEIGLVPPVFFKQVKQYKINNPSGGRKLNRFRVTKKAASDESILQRYYKYLVTDYLTRNRPPEDEITDERKINIALGFTQATGKQLSSFYGTLKNSVHLLTEEELMLAIERLGAYDFIYPESRKEHLRVLIQAGRSEPEKFDDLEYYYDLQLKKVILLGRSALKFVDDSEGLNHLEKLQAQKKLLIGKAAVNAYITGGKRGSIQDLAVLLRDEGTIAYEKVGKRSINSDLSREEIIKYAEWLISVVGSNQNDPAAKDLNEKIIKKAFDLGIGPSYQQIARRAFSSLTELYENLNRKDLHLMGQFDDWPRERFANYLRSAGALLGRTPTLSDLIALAQEDRRRPSPFRIVKEFGTLTQAYSESGFQVYANGKNFMKQALNYTDEAA